MAKLSEVVQARIDGDQEFQTSIASLTDAEKATKIAEKRAALIEEEGDKALTISSDQKTRAEKAEQERDALKNDPRLKPADPVKKEGELSSTEIYLLGSHTLPDGTRGVHPEDVPMIQESAKVLGIDIKAALDHPIVQARLASEVDKRKSAGAQKPDGGGRGGMQGDSDAQFQEKLRGGYIPPRGSADAEREFNLRRKNTGVGRQY